MIKLSPEVKKDLFAFSQALEIDTPFDVNGGCTCECREDDSIETADDCECRVMCLTVATNDDGTEWGYQTGDNSFTGGCYSLSHWHVEWIAHDCDRSDLAVDLVKGLEDMLPDNR